MNREEIIARRALTAVEPELCWCCPVKRCLCAPCLEEDAPPLRTRVMDFCANLVFWHVGMYEHAGREIEFNRARLNFLMQTQNRSPGLNTALQVVSRDYVFQSEQDDKVSISCRVYEPVAEQDSSDAEYPLQVLVYYHGGGFCLLDHSNKDMDFLCQRLCRENNCLVVSVSYRLAPEHPFPAAVHDAFAALQWINSQALARADLSKGVILMGDSAGGNLACVMASLLRDGLDSHLRPCVLQRVKVARLVLVYPALFMGPETRENERKTAASFLPLPVTRWFMNSYYPEFDETRQTEERRLSPVWAGFENMPPTILVTAGKDLLLGDNLAALARFKQNNTPVEHLHYAQAPHGFLTFHFLPDSAHAIGAISKALQQA